MTYSGTHKRKLYLSRPTSTSSIGQPSRLSTFNMASLWKVAVLCLVVLLHVLRSDAQCTGTFTADGSPETLTSLNYPQPYPAMSDCTYTINAPVGQTVHIDIRAMDLEPRNSENVCMDKLMFYSGPMIPANKIGGDECGAGMVYRVSAANQMTIQFTSDAARERSGFSITYWAEASYPTTCSPGQITTIPTRATPSTRFLTLPSTNPSASNECVYKIEAPQDHNVVLQMQEWEYMDADGDCGTLEIYNGETQNDNSKMVEHDLCNKVKPFREVGSSGRYLLIKTSANAGAAAKKFTLRVTSLPSTISCTPYMLLSSTPEPTIMWTPVMTNNETNNPCNCLLRSSMSSMSIRLEVLKKADGTPIDCTQDYLTLYNGRDEDDSKKIVKSCSNGVMYYTSDAADVLLKPETAVLIRIRSYPKECNGMAKTINIPSNGAVHTIKPDYIQPASHCLYKIMAPAADDVIQAKAMSMLSGGTDDCVTVYDGNAVDSSKEIFRQCGTFNKLALSTGQEMTIEIKTAKDVAQMGNFQFSFYSTKKAGHCMDITNHLATRTPKNLTSPGYASGSYPLFSSCSWRFVSYRPDFVVVVEVTYSDLPEDCTDYAFVNDGEWEENTKLGEWCGRSTRMFRGTGQTLMLNFRADGDKRNHKGFEFKYYADERVARDIVEGTNVGLIAGILTAIVVGVSLLFLLYILCIKNRKSDEEDKKKLTS